MKPTFIHRVLVFSISGTYIVDLKDSQTPAARLACRLLPNYLADFLSTMVKMTQRTKLNKDHKIQGEPKRPRNPYESFKSDPEDEDAFKSKNTFQNHTQITLFNLNVS